MSPGSEELGITHYKLATFYYVHDLLPEAGATVRRASEVLMVREEGAWPS